MPDDVILRPLGRISEPSHTVAPPGSLLRADNCVMRAPGVLEPVPDLIELSDASGPANRGVWQMSPQFDTGTVPEQLNHVSTGIGGQEGVRKSSSMGTEIQYTDPDGSSQSVTYFDHGDALTMYPFYQARDGLYVADQRGVVKWENTDATELTPVRDFPVLLAGTQITGSTDWLAVNDHVRYVAVAVFEDANGLVTRSAPSPGVLIDNDNASPTTPQLDVYVNAAFADAMNLVRVEVYRTRALANTVALPNEYYRALILDVDAAGSSISGSYDWSGQNDETVDANLGSVLYTSSSQGGVDAINVAPPEHLYHAEFRGFQFWANVAEKEFLPPLIYDGEDPTNANATHTMTTATWAISTNTITGITDLDGAQVGMLVSSPDFPVGTYVTAITGAGPYTVTVSENATASGGPSTVDVYDAIYILWGDGTTDRIQLGDDYGLAAFTLPTVSISASETTHAYSVYGTYFGDASPYNAEVIYSSIHRTARQGRAQAWVSSPSRFAGTAWADLNTASGVPTTGGTLANPALHKRRIYWSKLEEPEHTTLLSHADLPDDIVGIGALEDALIILTTHGVHRLTGYNGNWRIDPIDTSVEVIGGRSTAVMGNRVYTLGNRGLLEIASTGVRNITDAIVADWFRESDWDDARIEDVREYMINNGGYHPPTLFGAADPTHREYALMCEGTDSPLNDGLPSTMLLYNAGTEAFSTMTLHQGSAFPISALGYARGRYFSLSTDQAPGFVIARQYSSGDVSAALFLIDNTDAARVSGNTQFQQDVAFRAMHEGDPTHMKVWTSIVWETDGNTDFGSATAVFQDGEESAEVTQAVDSIDGEEIRLWPPRAVARSTKLVSGLRCNGMTIYGLRATFSSGGRESPL